MGAGAAPDPVRRDEISAGSDGPVRGRLRRAGWWRRALWAAAVLVAAAVVGPDLVSGPAPADRDRREHSPPSAATPPVRPVAAAMRWRVRGDLAADKEFVAAALERVIEERPSAERVLLAQRLPDGGRLVLVGADDPAAYGSTRVHALAVPAGGRPPDGRVTDVGDVPGADDVVGWAGRGRDGQVAVVLLGRPAQLDAEVSGLVRFARDGTGSRVWRRLSADDGLVVGDVGARTDAVVVARPLRGGTVAEPLVLWVGDGPGPGPGTGRPLAVNGAGAPSYRGPAPGLLTPALREGTRTLVDLDRAGLLRVLWSGTPWKGRRLALVGVRRADGVHFQALVVEQDGSAFTAGLRAVPARQATVLPWLLEPFSPDDPTLLLCPTGPGSVVYRRAGRAPRTLPVSSTGVAALVPPGGLPPSAAGALVTVRAPSGRALVRTRLVAASSADPLALEPPVRRSAPAD